MPKPITEEEVLNAEKRLIADAGASRSKQFFGRQLSRLDEMNSNVNRGSKIKLYAEQLRKLGAVEEAKGRIKNDSDCIKECERLTRFTAVLGEEDINLLLLKIIENRVQQIGNLIREQYKGTQGDLRIPSLREQINDVEEILKNEKKTI